MLEHEDTDSGDLGSTKTTAILKTHWLKPELGAILVSLDMNMRRLVTIPGVEKEAISATPENRRHPPKCTPLNSFGRFKAAVFTSVGFDSQTPGQLVTMYP